METQERHVLQVAITILDPSESEDPAELASEVKSAIMDVFPDDGYLVEVKSGKVEL